MPELPEVERIAAVARRGFRGRRIESVRVVRGKYLQDQIDLVVGRTVTEVWRRGKVVLLQLDGSRRYIHAHNAMTGYWDSSDRPWTFDYVEGRRSPGESDVRVEVTLDDGRVMRFHDSRLFGRITVQDDLPSLGPDVMHTEFLAPGALVATGQMLAESLRRSSKPVKEVLMDQRVLAGVGNIYANEALSYIGLAPWTEARSVPSRIAEDALLDAVQTCMSYCIPTIDYGWLTVYRRKECRVCSTPVSRGEIGGRATFWCPKCQKSP